MAHKNKKKIALQAQRGNTFLGYRPHAEETKRGRLEKSRKKYKKDLTFAW